MRAALIAVLLAAPPAARAAQMDVGMASAQFLQIGGGARALGMGEAYTAAADGPDAVYWNPAGLSRMSRPEATYSRAELPAGLSHDFLAVGFPSAPLRGTLAFAVTRLSQDSLALVNASNQPQGAFSPHSEAYALAYGHDFAAKGIAAASDGAREPSTRGLAVGASIKYINENLGTRSAAAYAFDGGFLFRPRSRPELILAGAVRNFGSKLTFISDREPLPAETALSAAYEARGGDWRLLPALEIDLPDAGSVNGRIGVEAAREFSGGMSAAVRLGYESVSAVDLGILSGFTAGVGLQAGKLSFDAAFQPMALLGESFRLGAGWKF